jgi:hypothetical protein
VGQKAHELLIFVRSLAAQVVVEMCDDQVKFKLCPHLQQQAKKRHRVGPTRNRNQDSISVIEEGVSFNNPNELLKN